MTERYRIEQALAASELKLQQVFAQAPVAIIAFRGKDFVVELANPPYLGLLPGRDLIGRPFSDVVPELSQDVWDAFHGVFNTGEPFIANEWLLAYDQDGDGVPEDHWFNVVYNPLREVTGEVSGMIAVLTDVTKNVRIRLELERVNRELEEFAYVASHDLQEPLRMINIYGQMLIRRFAQGDETAIQYGGIIQEGITRMETLLRDLLLYSRTTHSDEHSFAAAADLSISLAAATSVLSVRIQETRAVIVADPLPKVLGETGQLALVFQNLLSNALKYVKDNTPQIHISAHSKGDMWAISVRDNGIGFEQKYAERIFGLFKRLHHKDEYPGTGLGLAICQRIVERYGGNMWAESTLGEGATFYFTLPKWGNP
jgi:signal transduction histidine kinase